MLFIGGISGGQATAPATNHASNPSGSAKFVDDDDDDETGSRCDHCGRRKRRGISCATLIFLLAIDALTIALLLILFYNLKNISGNPLPPPQKRIGSLFLTTFINIKHVY
jgi:hypothetical protein